MTKFPPVLLIHVVLFCFPEVEGVGGGGGGGNGDSELCKICMEHLIDCVLLECGHMVTCTQCGKQMAECPICRQYVVRVVRVFK